MIALISLLISSIIQMALIMALVICSYALTLYFLAFVVIAFRTIYDSIKQRMASSKLVAKIVSGTKNLLSREKRKERDQAVDLTDAAVA